MATGNLLEEIRWWTSSEHDGVSTWPDLRKIVLEHFLLACETLKLQVQLEHAKQKEGETISAYIWRYRVEATWAYPEERPTSEEWCVVASFLRGFADCTFAECLFCTGKVSTLTEAINTVLEKEAEWECLEQVLQTKGQESMEVNVVDKPTVSTDTRMACMMEMIQQRLVWQIHTWLKWRLPRTSNHRWGVQRQQLTAPLIGQTVTEPVILTGDSPYIAIVDISGPQTGDQSVDFVTSLDISIVSARDSCQELLPAWLHWGAK